MRPQVNFRNKNTIEKGFTLIELLVVIVILGILAAVVVFAVNGITNKGKASSCDIEVRTVNTALQAYYAKVDPSAYPAGPVSAMFTELNAKGLLQQKAAGATASYSPAYDATTGTYSASCPAGS